MRNIIHMFSAVAAVVMIAGAANARNAQEPGTPPVQTPDEVTQDPTPVSGELLSVNVDTMTFVVKKADGSEARFRYNEKTVITGAGKSVAGIATVNGAPVTVHF